MGDITCETMGGRGPVRGSPGVDPSEFEESSNDE
jgi:hypothetical protein